MGSKISNTEWWLVISFLGLIDVIQIILDVLLIGVIANRVIDLVIGMALPFYMKIRGVKMDSKKIGGMIGTFIFEQIPGLDALPLWSLDGVMNMMLDKADKKKYLLSKQAEEAKMAAINSQNNRGSGNIRRR
jgi:hypothetical protein